MTVKESAAMSRKESNVVYWAPRVLTAAVALLTSVFALDVIGQGRGFWSTLVALSLHLIPTFVLLAVLVLSWRREWVGGIVLISLGALYLAWASGRPFAKWHVLLAMAGPPVLAGVLFLVGWRARCRRSPVS